jgi:hypothetical protein
LLQTEWLQRLRFVDQGSRETLSSFQNSGSLGHQLLGVPSPLWSLQGERKRRAEGTEVLEELSENSQAGHSPAAALALQEKVKVWGKICLGNASQKDKSANW